MRSLLSTVMAWFLMVINMWVKRVKTPFFDRSGRDRTSPHYVVRSAKLCALCIVATLCCASGAFFVPNTALIPLLLINAALLGHGRYLGGRVRGLLLLFATQLLITSMLYLLLHGVERLHEGGLAVTRIMLAIIPGWWLSIVCTPQRIGEVLSWCLPRKWAFVMAASFSLLPYMAKETREIYQMQVMRGANITAKALCYPKHWPELIYCVLYPLLIQLLKLSKQMALAAKLRGFGSHKRPTHWPD